MNRNERTAAAVGFIAAALVYLGAELLTAGAWTMPAYSYAHNWISDLGAASSPRHALMNGAFIVRGLLFALTAVLVASSLRWSRGAAFVTFAIVHAIGGTLVGSVPEDTAGPLGTLHFAGALLAIGGGNLAVIAGGRALRPLMPRWFAASSTLLGLAGLASLAALSVFSGAASHGVVERGSVYTIHGWELMTGALLLADPDARRVRVQADWT